MARIRTIKPEFWTDEKVIECSLNARLLFIGIWNFADDYGNIQNSPKQIKLKILPSDSIDIIPLIKELATHGLLTEYSVDSQTYLHISGFDKHQVVNRPSHPQCPKYEVSLNTHGVLIGGMEGNGKEGKGNKEKINKKEKTKFGSFENVNLSDEEYQKLKDKFEDFQDRIERLSEYMETKNVKYKNHYAVILTWARNDKAKKEPVLHSSATEYKGNVL